MRIFNTLQELWDYCLFCPLCQKDIRTIDLGVGPDPTFEHLFFQKENHLLTIQCRNKKKNCLPKYQINCYDNTYQVEVQDRPYPDCSATKLEDEDSYFYFWLNSNCQTCRSSWTSSMDIEFEQSTKNIFNIGLEYEYVYLGRDPVQYEITYDYCANVTLVYRVCSYARRKLVLKLPLTTWDYSDQDSLLDKIKTYILFS